MAGEEAAGSRFAQTCHEMYSLGAVGMHDQTLCQEQPENCCHIKAQECSAHLT